MSFGQLRNIRQVSWQSNHIDCCLTHLTVPQSLGNRSMFTEPPRASVISYDPDIDLGHSGFGEEEFDVGHVDGDVSR